jgi:hypothetical protein
MYFLARSWTGHCVAAAIAGTIFAFNGMSQNFLMWPSHIATFSWLPWIVWLGQRAWRQGGSTWVFATLAAAMQMLAGGPESILITWLVLLGLACVDTFRSQHPIRQLWLRFILLGVTVTLLSAAQLLPFLQLVSFCQRDTGFGASLWAMPPWGWANFLVPLFGTSPNSQNLYLQEGQYWTSSYYAGIGTVLLGLVAVWRCRDNRSKAIAWCILAALVLALGDPGFVYRILRVCFPPIGFFRYPVKFVIPILALAPLLAAFGLAALDKESKRLQLFEKACLAVMLAAIGIILLADARLPIGSVQRHATLINGLSRGGLLITIALFLAGFLSSRGRGRILLACLLLAAFWTDFATHVPQQNITTDPSVYKPGWVRSMQEWNPDPRLGVGRAILSPQARESVSYHVLPNPDETYRINRLSLAANCNLLDDVPQAHGFLSLTPWPINNLVALTYLQPNYDFPALLDLMSVCQRSAPDLSIHWARRPSAMPMITAGQKPFFGADNEVFQSLGDTNLDFRQVAIFPPEARAAITATRQPDARVSTQQFANQRVSFRTDSPAPALVIISQSYYPTWKARIDGNPTRLWRADYAFQGIEVPAGSHEVILKYDDTAFHVGCWLSLLGVMILAGKLVQHRLQQRT